MLLCWLLQSFVAVSGDHTGGQLLFTFFYCLLTTSISGSILMQCSSPMCALLAMVFPLEKSDLYPTHTHTSRHWCLWSILKRQVTSHPCSRRQTSRSHCGYEWFSSFTLRWIFSLFGVKHVEIKMPIIKLKSKGQFQTHKCKLSGKVCILRFKLIDYPKKCIYKNTNAMLQYK